jgi:hypothetical protein
MRRKEGVDRRNSETSFLADAEIERTLPVCSEPVFSSEKSGFIWFFESALLCAQPGSSLLFLCVGTVPLVSETGGLAVGRLGSDRRPGVR